MKLLLWGGALAVMGSALSIPVPEAGWSVVLGGSQGGYLSPCGCTSPMSGGIRRRATLYREVRAKGKAVFLELGPLTGGSSRQDEIKAETLAEGIKEMGVTAVSLAHEDAKLGPAMISALQRLSGKRLVSTGILGADDGELAETAAEGPFVIGSWDPSSAVLSQELGGEARTMPEALKALADAADVAGKTSILMLEAGHDQAVEAAASEPRLGLIVYRSDSNPPTTLERHGRTILASPGPKGKGVTKLTFTSGQFRTLERIDLSPLFGNDPGVQKVFARYQQRVDAEDLLSRFPRIETEGFAGTKACISCHQESGHVWEKTAHAKALKTLEDDGHGRDPECVSCHVVRLDSEKGFRSRSQTPELANVGCESCHGPGVNHSMVPKEKPMPKVGAKSCLPCHVPDHSPGFDFKTYWPKIAH